MNDYTATKFIILLASVFVTHGCSYETKDRSASPNSRDTATPKNAQKKKTKKKEKQKKSSKQDDYYDRLLDRDKLNQPNDPTSVGSGNGSKTPATESAVSTATGIGSSSVMFSGSPSRGSTVKSVDIQTSMSTTTSVAIHLVRENLP